MINVDQITSRLAKMPDQALQQYAAMHKNDPYIMALAVSESNRRKQLRVAAQGAQGQMEMPKVADQMVAEMAPQGLPEESGIAQLPAGEMEFADGGIVAFAGGGDVERYQSGGAFLFPRESLFGRLQRGSFMFPEDSLLGRYQSRLAADPAAQAQIAAEREEEERAKARAAASAQPTDAPATNAVAQGVAPMTAPMSATPTYTRSGDPGPGRRPAAPLPPAAPPGATSSRTTSSATAPAMPAGLSDLSSMYAKVLAAQDYKDPAAGQLTALESKERAAAEADKTALERDQAKFSEAFKDREKRLDARAGEIDKQKNTNTGLAFLNAGLAIMSTPGGLATAIGKGARVGTEQFAAGLDKIRSAQDKLDEARDRFEELKLNRAEMSAKEIREAEAKIRQVGIEAEKRGIEGIRQAAQVNREVAKDIFGKQVQVAITQFEQAGATARNAATIAASRNSIDQQVFEALVQKHKGDRVAAYNELLTSKQDTKTDSALVMQYAKDPMALKILEQTDPARAALIKARINAMLIPQAQDAPTGTARP